MQIEETPRNTAPEESGAQIAVWLLGCSLHPIIRYEYVVGRAARTIPAPEPQCSFHLSGFKKETLL